MNDDDFKKILNSLTREDCEEDEFIKYLVDEIIHLSTTGGMDRGHACKRASYAARYLAGVIKLHKVMLSSDKLDKIEKEYCEHNLGVLMKETTDFINAALSDKYPMPIKIPKER